MTEQMIIVVVILVLVQTSIAAFDSSSLVFGQQPKQEYHDYYSYKGVPRYSNQYKPGPVHHQQDITKKEPILTRSAPNPVGAYSQAIRVGDIVYLSGQIGIDPKTNQPVNGFSAQAERVFKNLRAVAEAAGGSLDDIVKVTFFITQRAFNNYPAANRIMEGFFRRPYPARSTIAVADLPLNVDFEIEAIMHLSGHSKH